MTNASTPRASICIPTYNQAEFLRASVRSALAQNYDDFEVLLSINHCTDHTESVAAEFAGNSRLRIVRPPHFLTAGENFRFVLAHARGEYLNFLSSDDELYPDFLAAQIPTLDADPGIAFSFTAGELVDERGKVLQINRPLGGSCVKHGRSELERYIYSLRATGIALLFRRSMYERVGGLTTQIVDWEICIKLLCEGDVAYYDQVLARVTIWSNAERVARRVALIQQIAEFFDDSEAYVTRRYPELQPIYPKARAAMALREVLTLSGYGELQPQARAYTLELSSAASVRLKLAAIEHLGMQPVFAGASRADQWIRFQGKRILRTLDEFRTQTRMGR